MKNLVSKQVKIARVSLGWTVDKLSDESGISWSSIQMIEKNDNFIKKKNEFSKILVDLFNKNNIEFFDEPGYEPYIKIRKS